MDKDERDVFVTARNLEGRPGFAVVLVFSGAEEQVCTRRHDGLLYAALEGGVRLGSFRRWKPRPVRAEFGKSRGSARACTHLIEGKERILTEVDTYLEVRCRMRGRENARQSAAPAGAATMAQAA